MVYDCGGGPVTISDTVFSWEFTVLLDGKVDRFTFMISGATTEGKPARSAKYVLSRKGGPRNCNRRADTRNVEFYRSA